MLAKRPRILQRTSSNMQLTVDGSDGSCVVDVEHRYEKPKPGLVVPRQVIGFNPVNRDPDAAGASPRSVLTGIGNTYLQGRSPRAGVESLLLSGSRPWVKKGSEGVGLGIVVALSTAEEDPSKSRARGISVQGGASPCTLNQFQRSPPPSQPITIGQSSPLELDHTKSSRNGEPQEAFSTGLRNRSNKNGNKPACDVAMDAEMDLRGSIFSTASPSSSCNDAYGLLPPTDFLSACYFCKRQLGQGKDIYMYRGDKAFCTVECRYQQIVIDERKERCSAAALKSGTSAPSANARHRNRAVNATTAAVA